ncbi:MnmC family methyltransferase [Methanothermobacter wolfeii]|uniref:MnmC family methyltransferase n=1 Tax=Methanothermobacter wolfeii TaxID=145261 RepID=UPI0024B380FA|nr:MnmC family methyltransferase [Methanothermobacter wolfeii]MDI6702494.1 MnmC family methyltransferase [Methanothermobacter wolfeii]
MEPLTPRRDVLESIRDYFELECRDGVSRRKDAWRKISGDFIRTPDGSWTLESSPGGEAMHTRSGAITESLEKFVKPAVPSDAERIRVLDLCSGLGYNTAALLDHTGASEVEVDMVEISAETMAAALLVPSPIEAHEIVRSAYEEFLIERGFVCVRTTMGVPKNIHIRVHNDDARRVVAELEAGSYDAIFLDAFSPMRAPELYTVEFISILAELLKSDGVIATYTSAAPFRAALLEAGLYVGRGPVFGRRSGGTLASHDPEMIKTPLGWADERMIALSDAGIPFRDPELSGTPDEIIGRRRRERMDARNLTRLSSAVKTPLYLGRNIPDDRNGRRVRKNLERAGIMDSRGREACYIICPQSPECICGCGEKRPLNSGERINMMRRRLEEVMGV